MSDSVKRLLVWILTCLIGVAGFLCATVDGYEVAADLMHNGETGTVGFAYGAGVYILCVVLAGGVLKAARRASPWRTGLYLVSAIAILLQIYETWRLS
jgi:hypothetical protein